MRPKAEALGYLEAKTVIRQTVSSETLVVVVWDVACCGDVG